ncbi:squalene/phytoene synthase family protein [Streptomyces sp. NPDC007905]|uniref:phytoene/squalene synthase family protein n=1 Tax=Streptomyces sp. NPDC007905 TaxID=3364788 RepID=UPI0036EBB48B
MSVWTKSLDAAGIREPGLRQDYDSPRHLVRRFRRAPYLAATLLLPRPVLPHVVAATTVMHHGDNLLDTGPSSQRRAAWASWEQEVREALTTGESDSALVRTLVNTVSAHPRLRQTVESYLSTATAELDFAGFATEQDYQAYVDAYSFPAFMLVGALLGPKTDDTRYRAACRTFIEGSQRLDFVNDLAEDVREGRVGVPAATLEHFSLTLEDLAVGDGGPALEKLVEDQVTAARGALVAARELPALTPAPNRRLMSALVEIELLTADAVRARGAAVVRGSVSPPPTSTLRVLARRLRSRS